MFRMTNDASLHCFKWATFIESNAGVLLDFSRNMFLNYLSCRSLSFHSGKTIRPKFNTPDLCGFVGCTVVLSSTLSEPVNNLNYYCPEDWFAIGLYVGLKLIVNFFSTLIFFFMVKRFVPILVHVARHFSPTIQPCRKTSRRKLLKNHRGWNVLQSASVSERRQVESPNSTHQTTTEFSSSTCDS